MSQDLVKDILLQIQDQQTEDAKTLGQILGKLEAHSDRVKKLEDDQTWNRWLAVLAPIITLAYATARKLGVNI